MSIIKSSLILKWQKLTNYYADGWENSWEIWIILNYEAVCQLSQYLFIKIFFWSFPGLPWVSSLFESIQGVNEPCMPSLEKGSFRKKKGVKFHNIFSSIFSIEKVKILPQKFLCIYINSLLNDPFPIFRELLDSSQHQSYLTDVFQSKLLHLHISETLWYRLAKNICRGMRCKNKCVTKLQWSWQLQTCLYCKSPWIIKIDLQS